MIGSYMVGSMTAHLVNLRSPAASDFGEHRTVKHGTIDTCIFSQGSPLMLEKYRESRRLFGHLLA